MRKEPLLPPPPPPPPPPPEASSENPKNPSKTLDANPNPNPGPCPAGATASLSSSTYFAGAVDNPEELADSELLSREEVLRRRLRRLKKLERCYRDQYWALVEEVRAKLREYYWDYGLSPVEEERRTEFEGNSVDATGLAVGEEGVGENGVVVKSERSRCCFAGCKSKSMPLTRFCLLHILSDRNQTLYKACTYTVKSGQTGPIICGKPVLIAAVPSLCSVHLLKAQKHISQALKKAGLNTTSLSRPAPKFHVIIAEYLHQIQTVRREASNAIVKSIAEMDSNVS